jgi:Mycoplasma protein of unknown function, DUF285
VSNVTNFRDTFRARNSSDPKAAFDEPLTFWNTSSGTSMAGMFFNAQAFDQDLVSAKRHGSGVLLMWQQSSSPARYRMHCQSSFDTSRVVDMNHMFMSAYNFTGKGLSTWKTTQVTNMWNMFQAAKRFNGDVTTWDTGKVFSMVSSHS